MATSSPFIIRLLACSVSAAARAGKIIRDIMSRGELGIIDKGVNDLQTEADRSAQRCIVASLSQQFPNLEIVGEEGSINSEVPSDWIVLDSDLKVLQQECPKEYSTIEERDVVVWVDPLDGTSEYTQGLLECVTVLVGLSIRGKAVGGVIHQPYYKKENGEVIGRTLWGLVGLGIGGITCIPPPKEQFIIATTRSHSDQVVQKAVDVLQPTEVIRVGGAGNKVLLLMEGKAHAYVFASKGTKKWDICAPEAILTASGGVLSDIYGKPYKYDKDSSYQNRQGVLATPRGVNHESLVLQFTQDIRDALMS